VEFEFCIWEQTVLSNALIVNRRSRKRLRLGAATMAGRFVAGSRITQKVMAL